MDNIFQIKDEFKTTVIGFNGSGLPLGQRTDLDKLAELAQWNPALANLFVKCPTMAEINAAKESKLLAATEMNPDPQTGTPAPVVITPEDEETEEK